MFTLLFECGQTEMLFVLALLAMTRNVPLALVVLSGLVFFFRSPAHAHRADVVTSPAYGVVQRIEGNRVEIILDIFDVHIQYIPYKGVVKSIKHIDGRFEPVLKKFFEKSDNNERVITQIDTELGLMTVTQFAGMVARRIHNKLVEDQEVLQGDIMGIIKFSSRVDIELPDGLDILVSEGEKVSGSHTVLACPTRTRFG